MSEDKFRKSEQYEKAKRKFEDLDVEEQAVFIVESAVNMIVKSVQKAGDAFSKAFDDMKASVAEEDDAGEDQDDSNSEDSSEKSSGKKSGQSKKGKKHKEESESE